MTHIISIKHHSSKVVGITQGVDQEASLSWLVEGY